MAEKFRSHDAPTPVRRIPAWAGSMIFHAVLLVLLGFFFQSKQPAGFQEADRSAGISLKSMTDDGEKFEGEEALGDPNSTSTTSTDSDVVSALPKESDSSAASDALPSPLVIGPGGLEKGAGGDAKGMTTGGGTRPKGGLGGKASVKVFGVEGVGTKFVYVFDRSISMEGARLASAKRELLQSLKSLEKVHQFQIIFFNADIKTFDLSGGQKRIAFGNDQDRELAARWVNGVSAIGGTERYEAVLAGLRYSPDVIFFLTDEDTAMPSSQMKKIKQRNRGTVINTIEFGDGPEHGRQNFLVQLANQNGGKYIYVDTSELGQ